MRANTRATFEKWLEGRASLKHRSIWTDGNAIYSYDTCLLATEERRGTLFNRSKYTKTTTGHQNALEALLREAGEIYTVFKKPLPQGIPAEELVRESRRQDFGSGLQLVDPQGW